MRGIGAALEPYADRVEVVELDAGTPVVSDVDVILYDTFGQPQANAVDVDDSAPAPTPASSSSPGTSTPTWCATLSATASRACWRSP